MPRISSENGDWLFRQRLTRHSFSARGLSVSSPAFAKSDHLIIELDADINNVVSPISRNRIAIENSRGIRTLFRDFPCDPGRARFFKQNLEYRQIARGQDGSLIQSILTAVSVRVQISPDQPRRLPHTDIIFHRRHAENIFRIISFDRYGIRSYFICHLIFL
ncbi:MAG: hypothetical protein PHZ23_14800 [Acidiphilium sp.]|nr:hypothetical protein [Acidiphilium sp.]